MNLLSTFNSTSVKSVSILFKTIDLKFFILEGSIYGKKINFKNKSNFFSLLPSQCFSNNSLSFNISLNVIISFSIIFSLAFSYHFTTFLVKLTPSAVFIFISEEFSSFLLKHGNNNLATKQFNSPVV